MCFLGDDDYFSKYQPLTTMPKVELLQIVGDSSAKYNEKLMKMTPNVKTLLIVAYEHEYSLYGSPTIDFNAISTYLPKLENLGWQIYAKSHQQLQYKLDAMITGFSEKFCKKVSVKFRSRNHLSARKVDFYNDEYRKYYSILNLNGKNRTREIIRKFFRFFSLIICRIETI